MRRLRLRSSIGFGLAGVAAAVVAYWAMFGLPLRGRVANSAAPLDPEGPQLSAKEHAARVQERWAGLPITRLSRTDAHRASSEAVGDKQAHVGAGTLFEGSALEAAIKAAPGLSDMMKRALQAKIEAELVARSGSVEEYISYASADASTRWLTPGDTREWSIIDMRWDFLGRTANHADVVALAREGVSDLYDQRKGRWIGASTDAQGFRLFACKVRTRDEIYVRMEEALGLEGQTQRDFWLRANDGTSLRFRVPKRNLDDVLDQGGVANVIVLLIVVETEKGDRFNWKSLWVWNPSTQTWDIDSMSRKGWGTSVVWE